MNEKLLELHKKRIEQFDDQNDLNIKLFNKKNLEYGDDFFTGEYTDQESWLAIKRKIVRLENHYKGVIKLDEQSLIDQWRDLAVYSNMFLMRINIQKGEKK